MKPKSQKPKLTDYDKNYLLSVAVPRYVNATGKHVVDVWFEIFLEHLAKEGYEIVKTERGNSEERK